MFDWIFWASFVVLIPLIIALVNYKYIDGAFMPLIVNLGIGVLSEIMGHIFRVRFQNNLPVFNVFMLFDFLTFCWLFHNWGAFNKIATRFKLAIIILFGIYWILDNLVLHSIRDSNIAFKIAYNIFLVLMAVNQLVNVMVTNTSLRYNPFFYVCLGVIFYYSYSIFISLFIFSGWFIISRTLWENVWLIYVFFNVVCNLLFAISFIWIRRTRRFL
jgi:hypothetical protein